MTRLLSRISVFLAVIVTLYGIYYLAGWYVIRGLPANILIDLALYPQDIATEWALLLAVDRLSLMTLEQRRGNDIKEDFRRLGYTLYSGALGYRDTSSDLNIRRPQQEEQRARDLTLILYRSGINASLQLVDSVGCSAVHQAILAKDVTSAKFLLALERVQSIPGNLGAKHLLCRQDTDSLAKTQGLSLH